MKTTNYYSIKIKRQYRSKPKIKLAKDVVGFDTETRKGECFLLMSSIGSCVCHSPLETRLDFLCYRLYKDTLNLFFNLDYDFTAIIKGLPENKIKELWAFGRVKYKDFIIRYIPHKMFSIRKQHRTYTFYDIQQFFKCSLEKASSKYLNKHKVKQDVLKYDKKGYVEKHIEGIKEYCLQDCLLTKELGEYFQSLCESIGLDFNKPISTAALSQRFFMLNCDIPTIGHKEVSRYAFNSYYGGRFETFKRGYFPVLYKYDLKSAYPAIMKDLIDINLGGWIKSEKVLEDAYYGFIYCFISTKEGEIQPLAHRENNLITFPVMKNTAKYISLEEYQFIRENKLGTIKVIDGWYYYPNKIRKPFEIIGNLYEEREKLKSQNNALEYVVKIIMNSLYGKFFQLTKKLIPVDKTDINHEYKDLWYNGSLDTFRVDWVAGNLFNPVYAALITSKCRLQLLKAALPYKDSVISFYTDSIFSTEKIIKTGTKLGAWSLEGLYQGIILGNGVYTLRNDKETITRFRGFNTTGKLDLFQVLAENKEKSIISIPRKHRYSIGQWLIQKYQIPRDMLNYIVNDFKQLNINFDTKREWATPFKNSLSALQSHFSSLPLSLAVKTPLIQVSQPS